MAAIEGDRFKSWLEPYGVTGFPTLLYFEDGEFKYRYEGPRERKAIGDFMLNPSEAFSGSKEDESSHDEIILDMPEEVTILNHRTFEDFMESHKKVIVFFYAPWCGVCKGAKPSFFETAELMADEDDEIRFAVFNCDSEDGEDKLYVQQFQIKGLIVQKILRF